MLKRPTISERMFPVIDSSEVITAWNYGLVCRLLECVWDAYDSLREDVLKEVDCTQPSDDLERELTEKLFTRIQRLFDFSLPVHPMPAVAERESRQNPPAQPPMYDIAFILNANDRICWPVEAKILESDKDTTTNLGDYVSTFNERFMTCYYAPFSTGAAMLGYLKEGNPSTVLQSIASRLGCTMNRPEHFTQRDHQTSDHVRNVPPQKPYPTRFRCNHMMMPLN